MVYTERTDKCISSDDNKDNNNKQKSSSSNSCSTYASSSSSKSKTSSANSGAWSSQATSADKWKYNDMVKNNRDQFNGLHFS